jgi:hypothetical protein
VLFTFADKVRYLFFLHPGDFNFTHNFILATDIFLVHQNRGIMIVMVLFVYIIFEHLDLFFHVSLQLNSLIQVQLIKA